MLALVAATTLGATPAARASETEGARWPLMVPMVAFDEQSALRRLDYAPLGRASRGWRRARQRWLDLR
ncbi:MAG: hypothetical protein ACO2ZK_13935, partial [Gemmobacter sp.]